MKITFESKRGIKLVGILENEKTEKCVILVHGFLVDKDNIGRWTKLSKVLEKEEFAVFRFDFGEHGESDKAPISISGEVKDLESAIDFMKEKYSRIALVGHSLGGLCSLKLANKVDCVVSWAGATGSKIPSSFNNFQETNKYYIAEFNDRKFRIEKSYLEERKSLDPEELIGPITKPVLLIHGTEDNAVPVEQTLKAQKYLKNGRTKIIQGESHKFEKYFSEAANETVEFLKRYL